ncbi:hypothetical protein F8M41_000026 [Gigaspora margarita]|uniref:Uncharacterized protein n=1 Tax=Gigaspora margarita TaxID=4874 RepID=A0A8H4EVT5_GIGMA|nr:hypothetical protein F8M41_000026 [Gigaspora margarita]
MLPKYENTMNFQDTNTIYEYDNIINVELASIGKSELFCKVTFKEYNIPIILKSITIPKQFSLKEFIRDLIRHQNIKSHDNVLTIFGLTKQVKNSLDTVAITSDLYMDDGIQLDYL